MEKTKSLVCACLLVLLTACQGAGPVESPSPTPASTPQTVDFWEFTAQVNGTRRANLQSGEVLDLSAWTADFPRQTQVFTPREMDRLAAEHDPDRALTRQELAQDVHTAFLLLKTTYGAYDYFGGDEVFLPLEEAVLAELEGLRYPTASLLGELLVKHLSPVARDGHFTIEGQSLIAPHAQNMYYVPGLYLDSPDGPNAPWLRPTIADDGRIAYGFAALAQDPEDLPRTATLRGEEVGLDWQLVQPAGPEPFAFAETRWEGIPVLQSKYMSPLGNPDFEAQLERFSTCGEEYADLPLLVFDVRSNPGGSDRYMMDWFQGFSGQAADPKRAFAHKYSQLGVRLLDYPADGLGTWRVHASPGRWAEREGLVFLLQDFWTASSGETAVEFLRSVDNVVIVGSNSGGCALVPNNRNFYLPNSGLRLYFGTGLSFSETMENRDGTGYLPDLWVDPAQAREAVLRLVDYYHLNDPAT